jgi:hypothetical protein
MTSIRLAATHKTRPSFLVAAATLGTFAVWPSSGVWDDCRSGTPGADSGLLLEVGFEANEEASRALERFQRDED